MKGEVDSSQVQAAKLAPSLYMAFVMWDKSRRRISGLPSVDHPRFTLLDAEERERWEAIAHVVLRSAPPAPRRRAVMEELP